jgi:antitoxin component of MazEF toxin-antitoxin module
MNVLPFEVLLESRYCLRKRRPKPAKKKPKLQQLVAKVTVENCHAEVDWGKPMGKEAW